MGRTRLPREVLVRARAEASRAEAKAPSQARSASTPAAPSETRPSAQGKREKIVRALRKLHPMD